MFSRALVWWVIIIIVSLDVIIEYWLVCFIAFIRYSFGLFDLCLLYVWCVCVAVLVCVCGLLLVFDCFVWLIDCLLGRLFCCLFWIWLWFIGCFMFWLDVVCLGLLRGYLVGLLFGLRFGNYFGLVFVVLGLPVGFAFCWFVRVVVVMFVLDVSLCDLLYLLLRVGCFVWVYCFLIWLCLLVFGWVFRWALWLVINVFSWFVIWVWWITFVIWFKLLFVFILGLLICGFIICFEW